MWLLNWTEDDLSTLRFNNSRFDDYILLNHARCKVDLISFLAVVPKVSLVILDYAG